MQASMVRSAGQSMWISLHTAQRSLLFKAEPLEVQVIWLTGALRQTNMEPEWGSFEDTEDPFQVPCLFP